MANPPLDAPGVDSPFIATAPNPLSAAETSFNRISAAPIVGTPAPQTTYGISATALGPAPTAIMNSTAGNVVRPNAPSSEPAVLKSLIEYSSKKKDLRVKIQVPPSYQASALTQGADRNLSDLRGIIFPYTPRISMEHRADYVTQSPLHSNFAINFYKSSMIGDINIEGLFTVQNDTDAITYLSTLHLIRSLTKGRFGGSDPFAGSPPPVCRLHAYGAFMLDNVPISISSFKVDLPADVDYFYLTDKTFDQAYVPTRSTISLTCKPMYSRAEMLDATVPKWLSSNYDRGNGLL